MKILAVGDIHTKQWIVSHVEKVTSSYDKIVFVGDYVDDWGETSAASIETVKRLKKLDDTHPDKFEFLLGNHDYTYVNNIPFPSSGYSEITNILLSSAENREHKEWLSLLKYITILDGVIYSHAGVTNKFVEHNMVDGLTVNMWNDSTPIWARHSNHGYLKTPQVFGHTPQNTCVELEPNIWCIDTFSTTPNGEPIGDNTVLEIIDGKKFNIVKLGV